MHVSIIDTSVLCNIINIPHMNSHYKEVMEELKNLHEDTQQLLILPLATIIETGNHIAHIADGNVRRNRAQFMTELIQKTVNDEAPWTFYGKEFEREELIEISKNFADSAVAQIGIGDVSIIQVYKKYKESVPAIGSIRIWSLDHHLSCYHEDLPPFFRRNNR